MGLFKSKVFKNASWIIVSKIIQSVLGFVVSMLTARYLGPSNYGLISYASSLILFVSPVVFLGFNNILVHELTNNIENEGVILGTSIGMSFVSALICIFATISFTIIANPGEIETSIVTIIYSMILIFQVFDLMQYWFQTKLLSKYSSIVALVSYLIVTSYKVYLLITQKSVYWFAASNVIDYCLISVMLFLIYKKLGGHKLSFSLSLGKRMFSTSKHFIITGLMIAIFSQTDRIMIKLMIGDSATGYYSAAVSTATLCGFLYSAIIDSFRPVVFNGLRECEENFELNLKRLYFIVIYLSLCQSLLMTIFAKPIILIIYGSEYVDSVLALRIVVWFNTFSYLGVVRNIWILAKEKQKYLWIINLSGAVLNIVLNLMLIPVVGIYGASIASLLTQFFSNFVISYIIVPIRDSNRLMIESLNLKYITGLLKQKNTR